MARRRHFGNVRQQRSGRWQVRYKGPDGRERQGERTFSTKTEAMRHLAEIEADINRGTWADPKAKTGRLGPYADEWLRNRHDLAIRTRELYTDLLRLHIKPHLGQMPIGRLTLIEVRRWHAQLSRTTGPRRVSASYALLRAILNTAVKDGVLASNPCQIRGAGVSRSPERP